MSLIPDDLRYLGDASHRHRVNPARIAQMAGAGAVIAGTEGAVGSYASQVVRDPSSWRAPQYGLHGRDALRAAGAGAGMGAVGGGIAEYSRIRHNANVRALRRRLALTGLAGLGVGAAAVEGSRQLRKTSSLTDKYRDARARLQYSGDVAHRFTPDVGAVLQQGSRAALLGGAVGAVGSSVGPLLQEMEARGEYIAQNAQGMTPEQVREFSREHARELRSRPRQEQASYRIGVRGAQAGATGAAIAKPVGLAAGAYSEWKRLRRNQAVRAARESLLRGAAGVAGLGAGVLGAIALTRSSQ